MNLPFLSSVVATFVRVLGSTVVGEHSAVLLGGEGAVGDIDDPLGEGASDKFTSAEQHQGPIVWRPRPPESIDGKTLGTEGIGLRLGGSTVPVALRDLRFNRRFSAPKAGSVALVGYGGGFLAFDDTDDKESRATLYVPYDFVNGVPTKAHVIFADPSDGSMGMIHGDGFAVMINESEGVTLRGGESTWINVKDGTIDIVANKVNVQGTVALGGNPATAVPLLAGPASPPGPNVYISPA